MFKTKHKLIIELILIAVFSIAVYVFSSFHDILEDIVRFSRTHEGWELDEIVIVFIFLVFALAVFSIRRWLELKKALSEIKQLKGLIPICSACKKIRDDEGFWHNVEEYIRNHSEADFTHGICPDCIEKLYLDFDEETETEGLSNS